MVTQAIDTKGNFLYRLITERERGVYTVEFLKRKKPIKRFYQVLKNELIKRKLYCEDTLQSAELSIYEKWDYERNNPL